MSRVRLFSVLSLLLIFGSTGNSKSETKTAKSADKKEIYTKKTDQNLKKAVDDYKSSLQKVAENYDQNVKTATDRSAEMKELFDQGLISRRELEQSQQAIVDAKTKVTDTRNQIAFANSMKAKPVDFTVVI